ncbi:hypothetical protein ACLM5J_16925 [Nocardioides sp. Bht2]|uniref:hypothetical protein n=1 Tax=Nocardioides sp. Bht2 TaxID=3392297 RepID=UPI0039B45754
MTETCANCGAPRDPAGTAFCTRCGTPFPPDAAPTQMAPPTGQPAGPPAGQPQQPAWGQQPPGPYGQPPQQPAQQPGWNQGPTPTQQMPVQPGGNWGPPPPGGPGQPWGAQPPSGGGGNKGKIALIVGLVIILLAGIGTAVALVVSGDDDKDGSVDKTVSTEEFCKVYKKAEEFGDDTDIDTARGWANDMQETGVPEDISDDARDGLELMIRTFKNASSAEELDDADEKFSEDEKKSFEAFVTWAVKACYDLDLPSDMPSATAPSFDPSDLPSIDPSDLPSFDPSDLPSLDPSRLPSFDPSDWESSLEELESMLSDLPSVE